MFEMRSQEAAQLQALREMTAEAVAECNDADLLDLIYKLLTSEEVISA